MLISPRKPGLSLSTHILIGLTKMLAFPLFLALRYLLRYRFTLIRDNLAKSFPEKTPAQRQKLVDAYYHHISDLMLEPFLFYNMLPATRHQLATFVNPELLTSLYQQQQSVVLLAAHYGNWEYLINLPQVVDYAVYSGYSPLKNRWLNKLLLRLRSRLGARLIPRQHLYRQALHLLTGSTDPNLVVLIADQRPAPGSGKHHVAFLHQQTAVQLGAERLASATDSAVVYLEAKKIARFRYTYTFRLMQAHARATAPLVITRRYFQILEQTIIQSPAFWLWSHNRWKVNPT